MNASSETVISGRCDPLAIGGTGIGLTGLLDKLAGQIGQDIAAIDETRSITYFELRARSRALARAMVDMGVVRGGNVGVLAGNCIDWLVIAFAASYAGAVLVPLSTWSTREELAYLLDEAGCSVVFAIRDFGGRDFAADVATLSDGSATRLIPMTERPAPDAGDEFSRLIDRYSSADADAGDALPCAGAGDDAMILFTSGSTSFPKGVRLTQSGVVENGLHIGDRMGLRRSDRVLVPAPLFWAYGGCNALPATMTHGATLVLMSRFEAGQALHMIERHGCTAIYTLPTITSGLLRHPEFRPERVGSLRTGLTIGTPEDFRQAADSLGVSELCNIYGSTETYGNCAVTWHHWPKSRRASCQGPLLPGQRIRFRNRDNGELCKAGEVGLVEVAGRVSPGYFGRSASANETAFTDDGYYRTGDLGHLNDEGDFVFVGRASEMIKRSGINVSPAEVEDALMRAKGVSASAVVGTPDAEKGECIVAFVVGTGLTLSDLQSHCRQVLSRYKQPDRFEIVDGLPTTATGKLQRKAVKEMALELMKIGDDGASDTEVKPT